MVNPLNPGFIHRKLTNSHDPPSLWETVKLLDISMKLSINIILAFPSSDAPKQCLKHPPLTSFNQR
jgi:hypothetical protein